LGKKNQKSKIAYLATALYESEATTGVNLQQDTLAAGVRFLGWLVI